MIGYVIPSLQYWGIAFTFMLLFDLPIPGVAYALGWKFPSFAMMWIFVAGTLWWYLLSRGIELIYGNFIDHGRAEQPLVPKSEARKHG